MRVALFVPCYMDLFFAEAAMATARLLERLGVLVDFPESQTCCGQPMANTGCIPEAARVASRYESVFAGYEAVVCPSGSCTSMVRQHFDGVTEPSEELTRLRANTWELTEFLIDVLKIADLEASFPHKVGVHQACHGLRELRLGPCSERNTACRSTTHLLLDMVDDLEVVELSRPDECCGFGGTFAVSERGVSVAMGRDRLDQHEAAGAEYIVSGDASCLMHMNGLIRREGRPLKTKHIAEVLMGDAS